MIFSYWDDGQIFLYRGSETVLQSIAADEHLRNRIYFFADLTPPVEEKPVKCTCEYRIEPALDQPVDGPTMYGRVLRVYTCPATTHNIKL